MYIHPPDCHGSLIGTVGQPKGFALAVTTQEQANTDCPLCRARRYAISLTTIARSVGEHLFVGFDVPVVNIND